MKKKELIEKHVPAPAAEEPVKETFLDRLKKERDELADKTEEYAEFIYSGKITSVDKTQQMLLRRQLKEMSSYLATLNERIALLN